MTAPSPTPTAPALPEGPDAIAWRSAGTAQPPSLALIERLARREEFLARLDGLGRWTAAGNLRAERGLALFIASPSLPIPQVGALFHWQGMGGHRVIPLRHHGEPGAFPQVPPLYGRPWAIEAAPPSSVIGFDAGPMFSADTWTALLWEVAAERANAAHVGMGAR